jgi:glycosyltransferase involved in cell wall biosynthesis
LVFGFVTPFKGIEYALFALPRIIEEHPDTMLVIAGTVPPSQSRSDDARKYEHFICGLVEDPRIKGHAIFRNQYIDDRETLLYFMSSDVVILPNVKQSGPSEVLRIALSFSLPVIATEIAYNKLDLLDPVDGLLVPPKDGFSLAESVIDLLSNSEKRQERIAYAQLKASEFSLRNAIDETVKIYESCLERRNSQGSYNG